MNRDPEPEPEPLSKADFEALARFRFGIRRYLRFSEETVRGVGLTPQQYQLLLALKGFPGRDWATIRELAELLQLRHHTVGELVNRVQQRDLVQRSAHPSDGRAVAVSLTAMGETLISRLAALHRRELERLGDRMQPPTWQLPPESGPPAPGGSCRRQRDR
jgi:DNA-binding MarR family transcriptional regulator